MINLKYIDQFWKVSVFIWREKSNWWPINYRVSQNKWTSPYLTNISSELSFFCENCRFYRIIWISSTKEWSIYFFKIFHRLPKKRCKRVVQEEQDCDRTSSRISFTDRFSSLIRISFDVILFQAIDCANSS